MPIVQADRLTKIGIALLRASGASEEEASAVAVGCVNANLAGHDSHGVIAIPTYLDRIKAGHIVPGAKFEIVQESPATAVIDGHWGFGFHVNARAMRLIIDKAKTTNVAACTVYRQSHVGRLAAYPLMAMKEGMIGLATADSGRSPKAVAPFGGREARLGTNPISIAVPSDLAAPFYLDMATSAVAAGKVMLAAARGEQIPEGWLVDTDGKPCTDPTRLRKGAEVIEGQLALPLGDVELKNIKAGLPAPTLVETVRAELDLMAVDVSSHLMSSHRPLLDLNSDADEFAFHGREVYTLCRNREKSLFSNNLVEKRLKLPATSRNLNTISKIVEKYK